MKYQVTFEYSQITETGERLRSRGTQAKLDVDQAGGIWLACSIGDDFHGRGDTVKDAILDWLKQCPLV